MGYLDGRTGVGPDGRSVGYGPDGRGNRVSDGWLIRPHVAGRTAKGRTLVSGRPRFSGGVLGYLGRPPPGGWVIYIYDTPSVDRAAEYVKFRDGAGLRRGCPHRTGRVCPSRASYPHRGSILSWVVCACIHSGFHLLTACVLIMTCCNAWIVLLAPELHSVWGW